MGQADDDLTVRGERGSQSPDRAAQLDEPRQFVGDVVGTSDMTFESNSSSSRSIASKARK